MNDKDLINSLYRPAPLSGIIVGEDRFFDNSSLDSYRVCPRKFYFRHIRHFETEGIKPSLIFGSSWHSAMDFIWANASLTQPSLVEGGMNAFKETWNTADFDPALGFDLYPRTPERAAQMLIQYVMRYHELLKRYEIIGIEQPFIVPLNDDLFYVGKLDKVFNYQNGIYIVDHKTASSFSSTWLNGFSPNGQVDGYLHAGHSTYPNFQEVIIDGALVQKTSIDFTRIPIKRQLTQLSSWLWEVEELIDQIEVNEERLQEYRQVNGGDFLPAFPKCTTSCTNYYGTCPYIDLCKFWSNPERETLPTGFVESKWTPFDISTKEDGSIEVHLKGGE